MQGIAQKILAEPGKYSIQQLTKAVQDGVLPAFIGVPLIQDKVQQQKQAQMGQQAQAAPAGQPPIAQQVMAEAQGLQALPTNLPQNYAGGGIVAFEEGGPVERYQNKGYVYETPYDRMNRENREREAREEAYFATPEGRAAQLRGDRAGLLAPIAAAADIPSGFYNGVAGLTQMGANAIGVPRMGRALGIYDKDVTSVEVPKIGNGSATPFFDKLRMYAAGTDTAPTTTNVAPADTTKATATDTTSATAAPDKAAIGRGGINDLLTSLSANLGLGSSNQGIGGASALGRMPGVGVKPSGIDLMGETNKLFEGFNTRDEKRSADLKKDIEEANSKVTGKAYEDYKSSLQKEAEEFGADKAQAKNMAIFKAGLAMMAGTSRHALENIGKGAMVGAEDYQAAAKDIKKAQKENERAMAMIEQARRAEDIGNRDKAVEYLYKRDEALGKRDQYITSGVLNVTGKAAELANSRDIAQMQAGSHLAGIERSGQYHLLGSLLGSMGKDRNQQIQERRLQLSFEKENPIADVRSAYAKQVGLAKPPAPGTDQRFDATVNQLYANKFQNFLNGTSYGVGDGGVDYGSIAPLLQKYGGK